MVMPLNADMTIVDIVDAFLKRDDYVVEDYSITSRHGVILSVNISTSTYEENASFHASRQMFILCTGNTSVFVAVAPEDKRYFSWKDIPLDAWKNTSNHDSCWRSDGVQSSLTEQYFAVCEEVNKAREAQGYESVAPAQMSHFNHLGSNPLVSHADVSTELDPDSPNPNYYRRLTKIVAL